MIILEGVSKVYHESVYALRDVCLHIKKGDFCFLRGPSGAGKTTLLKLIYALEYPTSGQIYIQDRDITCIDFLNIQAIRRHTGFVFQDFRLIDDWSVFDNVAVILEILGKTPAFIRGRVWKMLKWVGLQHKVYERSGDLSGGERQRLALARSLIHDPDILLADEPVGSLDDDMGRYIMNMFYRLHKKGVTIIIASHREYPVIDFARVIRLDRGKVLGE
ncbi:MAG TPA: ATP-binding cassette domain-containing protein [Deltaproteobacteria bacterium]|nr:ATP-binding cassette domain-containing protein [Deltaproteobacteria bacterium]